jgi:pimeloyl-ACP methyl ester carboxylesterase
LSLLRWLGPWTADSVVPTGIDRTVWLLRDGPLAGYRAHRAGETRDPDRPARLEAYEYHPPREPVGSYLIAPGLHFLGPDDPRLDRFCRVLAAAGFHVVAPFLPAYVDLCVHPSASDDLETVARALGDRLAPGRRPTLFSISFGSWPAFEVAARLGSAIDGVITFGGYSDFDAAVRFCVDGVMRSPEGDVTLARDPLNSPALFLNILPWLEHTGGSTAELESAWRRMVYRTWGRMELKQPGRLEPFARELVADVPERHRELFLIGCGVVPGAIDLVEAGLGRARGALSFADPGLALRRLECPVVICHGRDDDVIPYGEAYKLARVLEPRVPTRLHLTGLYGHTGAGRPGAGAAVREAGALLSIARAIAHGSALRRMLER